MASMVDEFRRFQRIVEGANIMAIWGVSKALQMWLWGKGRRAPEMMYDLNMDGVPLTSKRDSDFSIPGKYYVGKTTEYHCAEQGVELVTLELPTSSLRTKILNDGDTVLIPPFVAHAFRIDRAGNLSKPVRKLSSRAFSYTFDIEVTSEGLVVPNGPHFNKSKMKFAETVLRSCALRDSASGLTYDNYRLLLHIVYHLVLRLKLSHFENALLLGMAFDWIQRLCPGKVRRARIAFGNCRRIFSATGTGYHDIRATGMGPTADLFLTYEHRTHLGEVVAEDVLPWINIERNVLIGDGASLEVGKGISIKEFSWIAPGASLLKHVHNHEGGGQFARCIENTKLTYSEIGPYALIGQISRILPKVLYIGKGSVVGTSSVVTRSVGDYAVVAGNPAKCVGYNVELSQRIEDQKGDSELSLHEHTIPYPQIVQRVKNTRHAVIVGARSPQIVVGAAYHFKNLLVVNSCRGSIPLLLKVLREQGLYNVCLQHNPFSIKEEMSYCRPSVLIWLDDSRNDPLEHEVLDAARENSNLLVVPRNGDLSAFMSKYAFIKNCNLIEDDHYALLKIYNESSKNDHNKSWE